MGVTLQKAKRRMEDQLTRIGFGKSKKKESLEEVPGSCKLTISRTRRFVTSGNRKTIKTFRTNKIIASFYTSIMCSYLSV